MIETPSSAFLDSLFAATAPASETIKIEFPGNTLEFRVVSDYTEMLTIRRNAQAAIAEWPKVKQQPDWKPYVKTDREVIGLASYFAQIMVGEQKLREIDFVRMAKERCNAFEKIREEINAGQFEVVEAAFDEAVTEAGKDSSPTPDGTTA